MFLFQYILHQISLIRNLHSGELRKREEVRMGLKMRRKIKIKRKGGGGLTWTSQEAIIRLAALYKGAHRMLENVRTKGADGSNVELESREWSKGTKTETEGVEIKKVEPE